MLGFSAVAQTPLAALPAGGTDFSVAVNAGVDLSAAVSRDVARILSAGVNAVAAVEREIGKLAAAGVDLAALTIRSVALGVAAVVSIMVSVSTISEFVTSITSRLGGGTRNGGVFGGGLQGSVSAFGGNRMGSAVSGLTRIFGRSGGGTTIKGN